MTLERSNKTLLSRFNRAARHAGIAAVAAGAFFFAGDARSHQAPVAPQSAVTASIETTDVTTDPAAQKRLDHLRAEICRTADGRALFGFSDANNTKLEMSDSKHMDSDLTDAIFIRGLNFGKTVQLNIEEKSDTVLMYTAVHELRHSWHKLAAGTHDMELPPKQAWIRDRVLEADCYSFEIHFGYEYAKQCGIAFDTGEGSYATLAKSYAADRDAGMAANVAYGRLMERAFPHVKSLEYDEDFLNRQIRNWDAVVKTPCLGVTHAEKWNTEPDAKEFAAMLRRATTVGIDVKTGASALSAWTDADFQSLDKTGGATKDDLDKLAKADGKRGEAKAAWDVYWQQTLDAVRREREAKENSQQPKPQASLPKAPSV